MRCELVATWALLALAASAFGQDATGEEDAVTEAAAAAAESAAAPADADPGAGRDVTQDAERDALEPGVPSAVLAADVRRREGTTGVMDELDLGRTEITGNQELPKVLYIVPWQKSDPGDLTGKPVNTLLDEVLEPIDRGEFAREVRYYEDLADN